MSEFGDTRIAYHLDGTRVFHQLTSDDPRSITYYHNASHIEFTPKQREYLNEDRRHAVTFYSTDPFETFGYSLYGRELTFFFPVHMNITGIWIGSNDSDRGFTFEYQTIYASASSDTTALDDGTWRDLGWVPLGSQFRQYGSVSTPNPEYEMTRAIKLNSTTDVSSQVPRTMNSRRVAWDAAPPRWNTSTISTQNEWLENEGLGIVPLYGDEWYNIIALRLYVTGSFDSIGDPANIHLYGRPTDPDVAGLTWERSDGALLQPSDLSWGSVVAGSGPHIVGPFRMRNTTDLDAPHVRTWIAGKLDWGSTTVTSAAYEDELYSPIMPYIQVRLDGGPWVSSAVSGKHIEIDLGDIGPGEISGEVEVKLDYTPTTMPPWSQAYITLGAFIGGTLQAFGIVTLTSKTSNPTSITSRHQVAGTIAITSATAGTIRVQLPATGTPVQIKTVTTGAARRSVVGAGTNPVVSNAAGDATITIRWPAAGSVDIVSAPAGAIVARMRVTGATPVVVLPVGDVVARFRVTLSPTPIVSTVSGNVTITVRFAASGVVAIQSTTSGSV